MREAAPTGRTPRRPAALSHSSRLPAGRGRIPGPGVQAARARTAQQSFLGRCPGPEVRRGGRAWPRRRPLSACNLAGATEGLSFDCVLTNSI